MTYRQVRVVPGTSRRRPDTVVAKIRQDVAAGLRRRRRRMVLRAVAAWPGLLIFVWTASTILWVGAWPEVAIALACVVLGSGLVLAVVHGLLKDEEL